MNTDTTIRLLVRGFDGASVGEITPTVGMKTAQGDVVKTNPKSIVIRTAI